MPDNESTRHQIAALIEKFTAELKRYTSPQYNEIKVCIQFVNPFFEALGWDMSDSIPCFTDILVAAERIRAKYFLEVHLGPNRFANNRNNS